MVNRYYSKTCPSHPGVIILCTRGSGINALGIIRALGRLGLAIYVVSPDPSNLAFRSKYCTTAVKLDQLTPTCFVRKVKKIAEQYPNKPYLYIDNDLMLRYFINSLEPQKCVELPGSINQIRILLDKKYQIKNAEEAGIDVPRSWFPLTWDEIAAIQNTSENRLIAKKRFSVDPVRDQFKVLGAQDGKTLCHALQKFQIRPEELFIQEYISGRDDDIFFGLSYKPYHSDQSVVITGKKLIQSGSGDGGVMLLGQVEQNDTVRDLTMNYINHLGYWGYFGIEFKYCKTTKKYFFIEVNVRPEQCNALARAAGVDLDRISYFDVSKSIKLLQQENSVPISCPVWIEGLCLLLSMLRRKRGLKTLWDSIKYMPEKKAWAVFDFHDLKPFVFSSAIFFGSVPGMIVRLMRRKSL